MHIRWVTVPGAVRKSLRGGQARVPFTGRIGERSLRAGRYRVTVRATAAGVRSPARRAAFTVLPAR